MTPGIPSDSKRRIRLNIYLSDSLTLIFSAENVPGKFIWQVNSIYAPSFLNHNIGQGKVIS